MKKCKVIVIIFAIIFAISIQTVFAFAHSAMLNVEYDDCVPDVSADSENEKWYELVTFLGRYCRHMPHEENGVTTIKYYMADINADINEEDNVYWNSSGLGNEEVLALKNDIIESIKKWDKIYFYDRSDGSITRKKLVNIVQGDIN